MMPLSARYILCLAIMITEGIINGLGQNSTNLDCNFHRKYCFFVQKFVNPIQTTAQAQEICYKRYNSWPLEIYDQALQQSVSEYISSLGIAYSLNYVFLNAWPSSDGWQYVQNDMLNGYSMDFYSYDPWDYVVYYSNTTERKSYATPSDSLAYLCSYNKSSPYCYNGNSLRVYDQCFTAHTTPKPWFEAQNDCVSRGGYLGIVLARYTSLLQSWLTNFNAEHWWIGIVKNPLKWLHNGKFVTWTNFESAPYNLPTGFYFKINVNENKWRNGGNLDKFSMLICMTSNFQELANNSITNIQPTYTTEAAVPIYLELSTLVTVPSNAKIAIGLCLGFSIIIFLISVILYIVLVKNCFKNRKPILSNNSTLTPAYEGATYRPETQIYQQIFKRKESRNRNNVG